MYEKVIRCMAIFLVILLPHASGCRGSREFDITVNSNIAKSNIFIDGKFAGRSPVDVTLSPGKYLVKAEAPGGLGLPAMEQEVEIGSIGSGEICFDFYRSISGGYIIGYSHEMAWSPDSKQVAYNEGDPVGPPESKLLSPEGRCLAVLSLETLERRRMALTDQEYDPARIYGWLEGDDHIVISMATGGSWAVRPEETRVLFGGRYCEWSNDLRYVLDNHVVYQMHENLSPVVYRELPNTGDLLPFAVSRRGQALLLESHVPQKGIGYDGIFYLSAADSGTLMQLNEQPLSIGVSGFSPSGKYVYARHTDDNCQYRMSIYDAVDGRRVVELPWTSFRLWEVDFTPDEKTILFLDDENYLVLYDLETGGTVKHKPALPDLFCPRFVDERSVLCVADYDSKDGSRLVQYNLDDGTYRVLTENVHNNSPLLSLSPDRRKAVYRDMNELLILLEISQ